MASVGSEVKKVVEKFCVVCGLGSHRTDWQDKDVVACDGHSKDEVAKAVQASKTQTPAPSASTPSPAPAQTPTVQS
jgi:hypothetical protein